MDCNHNEVSEGPVSLEAMGATRIKIISVIFTTLEPKGLRIINLGYRVYSDIVEPHPPLPLSATPDPTLL